MKTKTKNNKHESKETPVQIIPSKNTKHKTETRVFARNIHENYCVQPDCKFFGSHAQQGECFSTKDEAELLDWDRMDKQTKQVQQELLDAMKRYGKGKKYLEYLEAMYECIWLNWTFTIDECIKLRRDNRLLQWELERERAKDK